MSATLVYCSPRSCLVPHRAHGIGTATPRCQISEHGRQLVVLFRKDGIPATCLRQNECQTISLPNVEGGVSLHSDGCKRQAVVTTRWGWCPLYDLGRVVEPIFSQTMSVFGLVPAITPSITLPPSQLELSSAIDLYRRGPSDANFRGGQHHQQCSSHPRTGTSRRLWGPARATVRLLPAPNINLVHRVGPGEPPRDFHALFNQLPVHPWRRPPQEHLNPTHNAHEAGPGTATPSPGPPPHRRAR